MLLSEWLETPDAPSPAEFAAAFPINLATVYKWKEGRVMPRPKQIIAIERLTAGAVTSADLVRSAIAYQAKAALRGNGSASADDDCARAHIVTAEVA